MKTLRFVATVLLALIVIVQYRLWVGDDSVVEVRRIEQAVGAQRGQNERQRASNERFEAEVRDLKEGTATIEEQARRDLGLVGEGEIFYQVVDR